MTLEVWAYTQGEGTWPTSFGSWWTCVNAGWACGSGPRWAFKWAKFYTDIEQKVIHNFFRDSLSWPFSFLTASISPMGTPALCVGYRLTKNRGFEQIGFPVCDLVQIGARIGWTHG